MFRLVLAISTALIVGHAPADAGSLSIVEHDRRVGTDVLVLDGEESDFSSDSEIAPDLDRFEATVLSESSLPAITASVLVSQNSVIGGNSIAADGSASATTAGQGTAAALGTSEVTIRFSLNQTTPYVLQGFVESFNGGNSSVRLLRSFVPIFSYSAANEQLPLDQQGILEPGEYDYEVEGHVLGHAPVPPETTHTESAGYQVLFVLSGTTSALTNGTSPTELEAFPNPFRMSTRLVVPDGVREVRVVNAAGRLVRSLSAAPIIHFDGRDDWGRPLASGSYWVRAAGDVRVQTVKIVRLQ